MTLEQQHSFEIVSNRLSFEQYICITVDRYIVIKAMDLQWYRSMPIIQYNRIARVSIDTYRATTQVRKGVDRHLRNETDVKNLLFLARLEFLCKTGCVPQYVQYKEVTTLSLKFLIIRAKRVSNCYMQEKKNWPCVWMSVCVDVRLI